MINTAEEYRQQFRGRGVHISSIDIREAFVDGAEYMLKRVREWLEEYADGFGIPESESGGVYVDDLISELLNDMKE